MLERANGFFDKLHMLNGRHPAIVRFFAAAAYVGATAYLIKDYGLHHLVSRLWQKHSCVHRMKTSRLKHALTVRRRSNLVDHLIGPVPQFTASTSDVIYYYCDYTDQRTLQFDRILGSLLKQLFLNSQIPEHIESQLLQIYSRGTRSPPENTLGDIFCSIFELRPDICIVLDGLDECDRNVWQAMLRILKRLAAARQCTVKTFVTCVEEGSLAHHLKDLACIQLCPATTTEDITTFVASSVRSKIEDGDLRVRNAKLEQDIVSELVSRANGM